MLHRPGKPNGMHYLSHQSVDAENGIVVDVSVTAGNANDSTPYLERIEYMRENLGLDIQTAGADSAYGSSMISINHLRKHGIEVTNSKISPEHGVEIIQLYKNRLNVSEIAERLNISSSAILNHLHKQGVEIRGRWG